MNLVIYFPLPVEVRVVKMSSSKTSVDAGKKVRFDASAANDAGFLTSVVYESTNKQKKIYLAKEQNLIPFSAWVYLTHDDVFIHGPFDFAIVNGKHQHQI